MRRALLSRQNSLRVNLEFLAVLADIHFQLAYHIHISAVLASLFELIRHEKAYDGKIGTLEFEMFLVLSHEKSQVPIPHGKKVTMIPC